jgi:hypothetical protein
MRRPQTAHPSNAFDCDHSLHGLFQDRFDIVRRCGHRFYPEILHEEVQNMRGHECRKRGTEMNVFDPEGKYNRGNRTINNNTYKKEEATGMTDYD